MQHFKSLLAGACFFVFLCGTSKSAIAQSKAKHKPRIQQQTTQVPSCKVVYKTKTGKATNQSLSEKEVLALKEKKRKLKIRKALFGQ